MRRAGAALLLPVCQCQAKRLVLAPRRTAAHRDRQTSRREAVGQRATPYIAPTGRQAHARAAVGQRTTPCIARSTSRARGRRWTHSWRAASIRCACPRSSPRAAPTSPRATRRMSPRTADARRGQGRRRGAQAHGGGAAGVASREEADEVRARRARRRPGHGGPAAPPGAGGEDVGETPRWSDDDAAGRALNEIDDNWRDDPVLNQARARRRTLGGTQRRRPRRIVPPVPIVSPPPSTERLLRARDRAVRLENGCTSVLLEESLRGPGVRLCVERGRADGRPLRGGRDGACHT